MSNYTRVFIDNHFYFITAVIGNRKLSLLTDYIDNFKQALTISKQQYKYELYAITIMPDHFHMIINPENKNDYPRIVSSIKREFSKQLDDKIKSELAKTLTLSQIKHRESGVWQRRFYEHTIRNQNDLNHLTDYIHFNPVKHGLVNKAIDWKHSSFKKILKNKYYTENWCDFTENTNYD